jgi:hypothetical protein
MARPTIFDAEAEFTVPDWAAAWYLPWREPGRGVWRVVRAQPGQAGAVAAGLNARTTPAAPVRFVPAHALPPGEAYEAFIARERAVPTRDNLHDAFNGLVWLRLPRTKARLNAIQSAEIARAGVGGARGAVRDAATLFDENALLLHAPDALWDALAARRWRDVFGRLRPLWDAACVLVFGHAALEKLVRPYKAITCHVWRVAPAFDPAGDLSALDTWLARDLTAEKLALKPFAALPVLGIPGWWSTNENAAFYDDTEVFRAPRR